MTAQRYEILKEKFDDCAKKIERIKKKCEKYNPDTVFTFNRIGEVSHYYARAEIRMEHKVEFYWYRVSSTEVNDTNRHRYQLRNYVVCEVEGRAQLNGWRFVASIDFVKDGKNVVLSRDTSVLLPESLKSVERKCDHCNIKRRRNCTYVVQNVETGEFKQVGSSCLKDYTGLDAEYAAQHASLFDTLSTASAEHDQSGEYYSNWKCLKTMLKIYIELTNRFGFVPTSKALTAGCRSTKEDGLLVLEILNGEKSSQSALEIKRAMDAKGFDAFSEENEKNFKDCLEWLNKQRAGIGFISNWQSICSIDSVNVSHLGLLAALWPSYQRALERDILEAEKARIDALSDHKGNVKERIDVEPVVFSNIASCETQFGTMFIYQIVDAENNVFIWKTGKFYSPRDLKNGVKVVKGTVKGHGEYEGCKQTELTRCSLVFNNA